MPTPPTLAPPAGDDIDDDPISLIPTVQSTDRLTVAHGLDLLVETLAVVPRVEAILRRATELDEALCVSIGGTYNPTDDTAMGEVDAWARVRDRLGFGIVVSLLGGLALTIEEVSECKGGADMWEAFDRIAAVSDTPLFRQYRDQLMQFAPEAEGVEP